MAFGKQEGGGRREEGRDAHFNRYFCSKCVLELEEQTSANESVLREAVSFFRIS